MFIKIITFYSGSEDFNFFNAGPYNSTLYRFTISSSTPVIFVQTYSKKEVIPLYHIISPIGGADINEENIGDDEDEDDDNNNVVCFYKIKKYQLMYYTIGHG